jgi:hypothetical protein
MLQIKDFLSENYFLILIPQQLVNFVFNLIKICMFTFLLYLF